MSATRRQSDRILARRTQVTGVTSSAAPGSSPERLPSKDTVDPVCADPAVVLWDEIRAPDQIEEAAGTIRPPAGAPDKALH